MEVGRVAYYASQPWPFPMSIMIGCHAEATRTDLHIDPNEIEDARWISRERCSAHARAQAQDGLYAPPPIAIAHHIIRAYVERGTDSD